MLRSLIYLISSILLLLADPSIAQNQSTPTTNHGFFKGKIVTEWDPGGRLMILKEPFGYVDAAGVEWSAPKGLVTDGASIPQFLWSFVGGPFEGPYRAAAVIHDLYCITKSRPYVDVHRVFYEASLAAGEGSRKAWIMYQGVLRFGPRWSSQQVRDLLC